MHRVADGQRSDWEGLDYDNEMSPTQRRAHDTNGWDTPGNRVTFGRLLLGAASLGAIKLGYKKTGMVGLALSLGLDWVDGKVADATGTKMQRNGDLDAVSDMAIRLAALPVLASEEIIDTDYAIELVAANLAITVITGINKAMGRNPKSNFAGKVKTVLEGSSLVFAGINNTTEIESPTLQRGQELLQNSALLGNLVAGVGYLHELFQPNEQSTAPVAP